MKNQMKNKNPFLPAILTLGFLFAPFCYLFGAHTINATRDPIESPDWTNLARIILYLFAVCCFSLSFFMEQHIRRKSAEKIIKQGKDPDILILIVGSSLFLAPACITFFLCNCSA